MENLVNESWRSSREQIKQAKKLNSIPDGSLVNYFSFWSNYKPNWGGFIFNGVRI